MTFCVTLTDLFSTIFSKQITAPGCFKCWYTTTINLKQPVGSQESGWFFYLNRFSATTKISVTSITRNRLLSTMVYTQNQKESATFTTKAKKSPLNQQQLWFQTHGDGTERLYFCLRHAVFRVSRETETATRSLWKLSFLTLWRILFNFMGLVSSIDIIYQWSHATLICILYILQSCAKFTVSRDVTGLLFLVTWRDSYVNHEHHVTLVRNKKHLQGPSSRHHR